jgi:hypothetical protein
MLNVSIPNLRSQALIGVGLFGLALWGAWTLGHVILAGNNDTLIFTALGCAALGIAMAILRDWRFGTFFFLGWLMFEDLIRKYMGNNIALFFGKDILAGLVYLALFVAIRDKKEKLFKPPFLLFLSLFFWLGVLQAFNQNSPSIWYGMLGLKVYFYYIPLIYVGYAFVRSDDDLRKFLNWNLVLAALVAGVGITQSLIGNSFLNPAVLAPELQDLGDLSKSTPLSNQVFNIPPSVFVSAGRYTEYLILITAVALGTCGYLLLSTKKGRAVTYIVTSLLAVAALLSGNRGSFVWIASSAAALAVAFLWGAPWRQRQAHRMVKAIRWTAGATVLSIVLVSALFPEQFGSRIAYYTETLLPGSSAYEGSNRAWDYPIQNLMAAFAEPHWAIGNGTGTTSLGMQYVAKLIGKPLPGLWVEEGYGDLILEMGVLGPVLWFLWTGAVLWYSWKIVRQLRETRYFPLAAAILWYSFLMLYPLTYISLSTYQNYTCNAYFWLLLGVLFRLPELQMQAVAAPVLAADSNLRPSRGGLHF